MNDRNRGRRRLVTVLAALTAVVVAAVVWHPAGSSRAHLSVATAMATTPTESQNGVGPAAHRDEVGVGWRHDLAGATAAAASDVQAIELVAVVGPLERNDIIDQFTTSRLGPSLASKTNQELDNLLFELGAQDQITTDLVWREYPLAIHVDSQTPDRVTVEVWSVSVLLVTGGSVARQVWHTDTLTMVWRSGDWKADRWHTTDGPTPGLATDADLSPVDVVRASMGWTSLAGGA
jgi:hypothetical protein